MGRPDFLIRAPTSFVLWGWSLGLMGALIFKSELLRNLKFEDGGAPDF